MTLQSNSKKIVPTASFLMLFLSKFFSDFSDSCRFLKIIYVSNQISLILNQFKININFLIQNLYKKFGFYIDFNKVFYNFKKKKSEIKKKKFLLVEKISYLRRKYQKNRNVNMKNFEFFRQNFFF